MALLEQKEALVQRLLAAKAKSGKTYDQIAKEVGLTNAYTAQLFFNQAQLKPDTAPKLKAAVPDLSDADVEEMKKEPMRAYDPTIIQEPLIYRLNEAVMHYGRAIKDIVNEQQGDGIMSAIGFFMTVEKVKGKEGEPRVKIVFNGKFLPHVEQKIEDNVMEPVQ
eukprot:TRINITY_DN17816_c0_g1_i1.p1 TRINITY_DN17816_c0_g1~~TRINITY_DN17816_c0_g1_i1.p1  ORF type:complete len:164 (+),score=55.12 TRINITY_DN17816_c0_g1_i1:220-711(+)